MREVEVESGERRRIKMRKKERTGVYCTEH